MEGIAGELPGQHGRLPDEPSGVGPILFFSPFVFLGVGSPEVNWTAHLDLMSSLVLQWPRVCGRNCS